MGGVFASDHIGMSVRKQNGFQPAPHANAEVHRRIMHKLKKMSASQIFETSVRAGIHRKDGKLRRRYTTTTDTPAR